MQVESESTERPPRTGVVEEVVQGTAYLRYRISWDDGQESIYTPAAGALHSAEPTEKRVGPKAQGAGPVPANARGRDSSWGPRRPTAVGSGAR